MIVTVEFAMNETKQQPVPKLYVGADIKPRPTEAEQAIGVCLAGGKKITRLAIRRLLETYGLATCGVSDDQDELSASLTAISEYRHSALVLIVSGADAFSTLHAIHETLVESHPNIALVVLSESGSRAQVYAALRIGAKGFVNLDSEPDELVKAVRMASQNRVYLSSDVAELLVNDISKSEKTSHTPHLTNVSLSKREVEVVQLLCEGLSSKEIGHRLHISPKTVENHRYNIYRKCEVDNVAALMRHAIEEGLISL